MIQRSGDFQAQFAVKPLVIILPAFLIANHFDQIAEADALWMLSEKRQDNAG